MQPPYTTAAPLTGTISEMVSNMRFVGIATIIYGAICSITIIYAIVGVPLIFAGIRLRESADQFELFGASEDRGTLAAAMERLTRTFSIIKILIIVSLILTALFVVLYGVLIASLLGSGAFANY